MANYYQEAIDLKIAYGWDSKEWGRRTGIRQDLLEAIEARTAPMDRDLLQLLLEETRQGRNRNTKELKRFVRPNIVATTLHKGGGGKTTVTLNLAGFLAAMGYNVLVIDSDSQMDLTGNLLGTRDVQNRNLYNALCTGADIRTQIVRTDYARLDIVPSHIRMAGVESMLSVRAGRSPDAFMVFRKSLGGLVADNYYDFVFVDMDKTIGNLNETILNGCTHLLMVAECAVFHLKGIGVMTSRYDYIRSRGNPGLKLLGVVLNKVPAKKEIVSMVNEILDTQMPGMRFLSCIREDPLVVRSQWDQKLLCEQSRRSRAYADMLKVTEEFLTRIDTF